MSSEIKWNTRKGQLLRRGTWENSVSSLYFLWVSWTTKSNVINFMFPNTCYNS